MTHSYIERPRAFCAFGGALSALEALPETITIMHAAIGCAASIAWGQVGGCALNCGGYCGGLSVPSSNITEREVVFGGAERLREQIDNTLQIMNGRLFVVITSCTTEVIGDDALSVVNEVRDELEEKNGGDHPEIVFAETGGFHGDSYKGYDIVMSAIARQFVKKTGEKKKGRVNIFGIAPYMDCFWRGNLEGIRKSLELLGLEVHTFFTGGDTLEALRESGSAELNIVVSDLYGIQTVETYKKIHDVPYIKVTLPVGPALTEELLRKTVDALHLDVDVDAIIKNQYKEYYHAIEPLLDTYFDGDHQRYAVIVADINYAVSLTHFLYRDLGWIPAYIQFTDPLDEAKKNALRERVSLNNPQIKQQIIFDTNASEAGRYILDQYPKRDTELYVDSLSPAFVFGSSLERELAAKLSAPHLSVSFPILNRAILARGYTGFQGGLTLIEDILSSVVATR